MSKKIFVLLATLCMSTSAFAWDQTKFQLSCLGGERLVVGGEVVREGDGKGWGSTVKKDFVCKIYDKCLIEIGENSEITVSPARGFDRLLEIDVKGAKITTEMKSKTQQMSFIPKYSNGMPMSAFISCDITMDQK